MADIVDAPTRSRMMSGIRGSNTQPEMRVRSYLHSAGLRFTLRSALPGRPDLVLPKFRSVVMVHGCYWHRHKNCKYCTTPKSNVGFWMKKFEANVSRDAAVRRQLRRLGWKVYTVWACRLGDESLALLAQRIRANGPADR